MFPITSPHTGQMNSSFPDRPDGLFTVPFGGPPNGSLIAVLKFGHDLVHQLSSLTRLGASQ